MTKKNNTLKEAVSTISNLIDNEWINEIIDIDDSSEYLFDIRKQGELITLEDLKILAKTNNGWMEIEEQFDTEGDHERFKSEFIGRLLEPTQVDSVEDGDWDDD